MMQASSLLSRWGGKAVPRDLIRGSPAHSSRLPGLSAREELILSRRTHLDQLAHKLAKPRVRRVVEPLLTALAEGAGTEVGNLAW